MIRERKKQFVA